MEKKVEKNVKCEICEKVFSSKKNHKRHVTHVHKKDKQRLVLGAGKVNAKFSDLSISQAPKSRGHMY